MALTKADIVQSLCQKNGYTLRQSIQIVGSLIEIIKNQLVAGDDVLISGFGKFCVKEKSKRRGRNPATGDDMMLDARRIVTFKCSGKLRDRINS